MIEQDGIEQTTELAAEQVETSGETAEAPEAEVAYQSMEELLEQEDSLRALKNGTIITGTVERLDEHGALVNVGAKSEGQIPPEELGRGTEVQVGDEIAVYVVDNGARDGNIILSKKRADYEKAWNDIIRAFENGETLSAMVIDRVKGGLVVDLGMRGFLPASHVATKNVNALDRFVGQSIRLKVIEVDRNRKRVVVSQKQAVEEEKRARREVTITTLEEGQIRRGVVRRVTDYGAFVDLGGIDGLLHVTEMSWSRINHPSDIVKPGQKIDVMVLKYDPEQEKISLGLKQILPDPWQHVDEFYNVGDTVVGTVTRLVPFGAFVALDHGIEGIIPIAELADQRIRKPDEVVAVGQQVKTKIVNIRPTERRMTLSLRQVAPERDEEVSTYMATHTVAGRGMTIGEMLGDVFAADEVEDEVTAVEVQDEAATVDATDEAAVDATDEAAAVDATDEAAVNATDAVDATDAAVEESPAEEAAAEAESDEA
jgi:4-hydroxy-3-methylbut-2-enyl diphosphate reductase